MRTVNGLVAGVFKGDRETVLWKWVLLTPESTIKLTKTARTKKVQPCLLDIVLRSRRQKGKGLSYSAVFKMVRSDD